VTDKLFERIQVDWEIPKSAIAVGENRIIHWPPVGELTEVDPDSIGVGTEIMRSVVMNQHTGRIESIIGVARDVRPPINDEAPFAKDSGKPLRQHCPSESRSNYQQIDRALHAG